MEQPSADTRTEKASVLRILVAGRFLQPEEVAQWMSELNGTAYTCLWLAVLLLLGIFSFSTLSELINIEWYFRGLLLAFLAACCCLCLAQLFRFRKRERHALSAVFSDRLADKKAAEAGCTFAFYDDRVVSTSLRGSDTIWFSDVVMCTETVRGLVLQTKTAVLFLRSADLTAFDLHCIRTQLQTFIPPARHRVKAPAVPGRQEALPIPRFFNFDNVLVRATVPVSLQTGTKQRQVKSILLPMLLAFSVLPAVSARITPWVLLDLAIYALVFCGVGLWLAKGLERRLAGVAALPDLQIAFTKEGLAVLCGGITEFTVKERLFISFTPETVRIRYTNGEWLCVPLSSVDRPDLLKTLWLNDASGV